MCVPLGTALLCVAVIAATKFDACKVSQPKQTASTSVQLTAQRNDTGFWTTQFGEYQMLIEHWHFDTTTYDQDGEDSTWTIKVKHSSTVYQDITTTHNSNSEGFGQLVSTISKLTDKNVARHNVVGNKRFNGANSREDGPFNAGSELGATPTLSNKDISEETELHNDDSLYKAIEEKLNETPDETEKKRNEKHKLTKAEEERKIMDRYSHSWFVVQDVMQHNNHRKGYRFYYGTGWLKLNTSDWQWPEAREACEEDGGHLAVPDTTQKISTMRQILEENADILKHTVLKNQVFVGLFYPDRSRSLTTVLGKLFQAESDSVWFPHEPNNAPPGEDCITLHLEGKMRDVPCFYTLPFICEID